MRAPTMSRRLLAAFLALILSLSFTAEALAADSATAVTMQLSRTEGTVAISNSSGKNITLIQNMRLRSGYKVATEEKSYAWVNLDSSKLIKEDAVSEMSIRKSGKKLELLLNEGNLFFNVTEPLDEDESLNIRTSTMIVGIRGTSGWVKIIDQWTSELYILEGTVTVTVTDPVTGQAKTDTVTSGEKVVCKVYPQGTSGDKCDILRDRYTVEDIDGFVLVELAQDQVLRDKAEAASGLRLDGVDAEKRLKDDQTAVRQKLEQINKQAAQQANNVSVEPVWSNPQADAADTKPDSTKKPSGSTGGGSYIPAPTPSETITLTMPQEDDTVNDYLSRSTVRNVILVPGTATQTKASTANLLEVDSGLTVPAGKTLTLQSGVGLDLLAGQTMEVSGTVTVNGSFTVYGILKPASGVSIRAWSFALINEVPGWKSTDAADSSGFYSLVPAQVPATYTITFDSNGGTPASSTVKTDESGRVAALPAVTRTGYTFKGWFTAANSGTEVTASTVYDRDTTVYAHWTAVQTWNPDEHTYQIIREKLTWTEAKAACEKLGGHLATITCAEEQSYIESLNTGNARLWIGARRDNSNNWTWVTGEPWEYTNWAPGQPDNSPNVVSNENCVVLWPKQWNDLNENNKSEQSGYICEWDNTSTRYTITFVHNNGSGLTSSAQTDAQGKLPISAFPDLGVSLTFKGWYDAPTGGNAVTEETVFEKDTNVYAQWGEASAPTSGSAGENAFWEYDRATKTLRIWSNVPAQMDDYGRDPATGGTAAPWAAYVSEMQKVTIEYGIDHVGSYAFYGCGKLEGPLTVTSSVTEIGSYAYAGTGYSGALTLQDRVTEIGEGAFQGCSGLTSLKLYSSMSKIEDSAFDGCTGLTDVYFEAPKALWEAIDIGTKNDPLLNATIHCTDGDIIPGVYTITFNANGGTVTPASAQTRPNGTLASLPTPTREGYTFKGWTSSLEGGLNLSLSTQYTSDSTIYAQWTQNAPEGVTWRMDGTTLYIEGNGTMESCEGYSGTTPPWSTHKEEITSVVIGEGVTTVYREAFSGYPNLVSVTLPDSITTIGYEAFYNCGSLISVTIPRKVTTIDTSAFYGCDGLQTVKILGDVSTLGLSVFRNCTALTTVEITGKMSATSSYMFQNCTSLTSVTLPDSMTAIARQTFTGCTKLEDVVLPAELTTIGYEAFYNCDSLTNLTIPSKVTTIEQSAFWGCNGLKTLKILGDVSTLGLSVFRNCTALTTVEITGKMPFTSAELFEGCTSLTNVTLPESMTTIARDTFYGCTKLEDVVLPAELTTIGYEAFYDCDGLTNLTIPSKVTTIEQSAFYGCNGLKTVKILGNIATMGAGVFRYCTSLTSAVISGDMPTLSTVAFGGCTALTDVSFTGNLTTIVREAFTGCTKLTNITLPATLTSVGYNAFRSCSSLAHVYFGGTAEQWGAIEFDASGNTTLTSAEITYNHPMRQSIVSDAAPGYADVPADAWYADAVAYCREHGLMNGVSATEFAPDATLTRAMTVTVLHRLAGTPAAASTEAFTDVEAGQWYTEAVSWANSMKIVQGYGDGTFGTDDPVTHEQVALIFQRYSGDSTVQTIGMDTPQSPATRAEVAATLMQFGGGETLEPGTLSVFSAMNIMCGPSGIAADRDGSLLVTDLYHKQVWRVVSRDSKSYAGGATVQDLYGQPVGGYNDAGLDGSYFKEPWAIAPFLDGWAVSDTANNAIRLVRPAGVQTVNGVSNEKLTVTKLGVAFDHPTGLAADEDGNLYVSDTFNGAVRKITPRGGVSTVASNLSEPTGLAWKNGVLYIAETGADRVVKVQDGKTSTVASGFDAPQGVAVGGDGTVYVADTGNGAVRKVSGGVVTTLASRDMQDLEAGLTSPSGLLVQAGKLYICDAFARKIFVYRLS